MATLLTGAQCFHVIARRFTTPSRVSGVRILTSRFGIGAYRPSSSDSSSPSSGEIKYPFKVAPMEVKPPEEYTNVLSDPIEHATGFEKKHLLAQLQGDDRYETKVYHMRAGTKDDPNIIPSHLEARIIGCLCEPDQHFVNYMWLLKDKPKRCSCGHWFKLVDAEPDLF